MGVVRKPLITEKSQVLSEQKGQYVFIVDRDASKPQIIDEIQKIYGVEVAGISTMIYRGKNKNRFTRQGYVNGKSKSYKKAIVTLKDDQTIDFFESV
jgi:large subunit ribosomal protein L23